MVMFIYSRSHTSLGQSSRKTCSRSGRSIWWSATCIPNASGSWLSTARHFWQQQEMPTDDHVYNSHSHTSLGQSSHKACSRSGRSIWWSATCVPNTSWSWLLTVRHFSQHVFWWNWWSCLYIATLIQVLDNHRARPSCSGKSISWS